MVTLRKRAYSILIACLTVIMVALFAVAALIVPPKTTALAAEQTVTLNVYGATGTKNGTTSISWEEGGVTFTNYKTSNSNAIRNSDADHYRAYANSTVEISAPGNITEIVITATGESKYKTPWKDSAQKVGAVTSSGDNYTVVPATPAKSISFSATAQVRLKQIAVTYEEVSGGGEPETPACTHDNTTPDGTYTQLANNKHAINATCDDCGESVQQEVACDLKETGNQYLCVCSRSVAIHTITLYVNGQAYGAPLKTDVNQQITTFPESDETFEGYGFYGWVDAALEPTDTAPANAWTAGAKTFNADASLYAVYAKVGTSQLGWFLQTSTDDWAKDDQVIIAAFGSNFAMSTTQNGNNRGQASITKDTEKNTLAPSAAVQVFTLKEGKSSGTFAFYTGSGYLYAASSSNNYLRTETNLSSDSSWKVTIAADGKATIVAQGSNKRNTMQYNSGSSLFACYETASQKPIAVYRHTSAPAYTGFTTTVDTSCQHKQTKEVTIPATCTTPEFTQVVCVNEDCQVVLSSEETGVVLGHLMDGGVETTPGTCTQKAKITTSCQRDDCDYSVVGDGDYGAHVYDENNICDACGLLNPLTVDYSGTYYFAFIRKEGNYFFGTNEWDEDNKRYPTMDSGLTELPAAITAPEADKVFTIVRDEYGTYEIYVGTEVLPENVIKTQQTRTTPFMIVLKNDGLYEISFVVNETTYYLSMNSDAKYNYFRDYKAGQMKPFLLPVKEVVEYYELTYSTPTGVDTIDSVEVAAGATVTLPAAMSFGGYNFVGWVTEQYETTETIPTYYAAGSAFTMPRENTTLYALYSQANGTNAYRRVTEALDDWSGEYLIVYERASGNEYTFYPGPQGLEGQNNISSAFTEVNGVIAKDDSGNSDSAQFVITKTDGGYTIRSSNKKYIGNKTGETGLLANVSQMYLNTISLNDDGTIDIVSGGAHLRIDADTRYIRYYSESEYGKMSGLHLYRYCAGNTYSTPSELIVFDSASLTIGKSLNMNYFVEFPAGYEMDGVTMTFTMGKITQTVTGQDNGDGRYCFTFTKIAPQFMGAEIVATLKKGETVLATMKNYSVRTYAMNLINKAGTSDALKQLLYDVLAYGAAAQEYKRDYSVSANVGYEALAGKAVPTATDAKLSEAIGAVSFKSAGLWFDNVNMLYVTLEGATEGVSVKAFVGSTEVALTEENGTYYTDALYAIDFDKVFTFKIMIGEEVQQVLEYSVNSYVFAMKDKPANVSGIAKLVKALYNYGLSAKAYKGV